MKFSVPLVSHCSRYKSEYQGKWGPFSLLGLASSITVCLHCGCSLLHAQRLGPWVWGDCPWLLWSCECSCHSTPNIWFDVILPIWVITLYWVHQGLMNRVLNYCFSLIIMKTANREPSFEDGQAFYFQLSQKLYGRRQVHGQQAGRKWSSTLEAL